MNFLNCDLYRLGNAIYRRNTPVNKIHRESKKVVLYVEEEEQEYDEGCSAAPVSDVNLVETPMEDEEGMQEEDGDSSITFDKTRKCWTAKIEIPSMVMGRFIGKQGSNLKKMEESTKCKIQNPQNKAAEPSIITSVVSRSCVQSCLDQITLFLLEQRDKGFPTHFISLPLKGDIIQETYKDFVNMLIEFSELPEALRDATKYTPSSKIHLTICVTTLFNKEEVAIVGEVIEKLLAEKIRPLLKSEPLLVDLRGLDHFGDEDPAECRVLYAKPSGPKLQKIADIIYEGLLESGYGRKNRTNSPLLHMTIMKTAGKEKPFDARPIFQFFKDHDFGQCQINDIQICRMGEIDVKTGGYPVHFTSTLR